jgi:hypothetical protein
VSDLVVEPIDALGDVQLGLTRILYEEAFGAELRVPFSELTRQGDADRTYVAVQERAPAGFAALRLLSSVEWAFLRYFAIGAELRSQGLGQRFWQILRLELQTDAWPANVVFEVEDPGETAISDAERVIRDRRIKFWSVCGARMLPVSGYVLPDYGASGATEPMLLMAATAAGERPPQDDGLRRLILAIYAERYGMAPDEPMVSRAVASVAR